MSDPIAAKILGFPKQDLHFQETALDQDKCRRYLALLSPSRREEAKRVLDATLVFSTKECMDRLRVQASRFVDAVKGEPFYIHITVYKVGSEHMALYLFRDLLLLPNFGGFFCDERPSDTLPQFAGVKTAKELFLSLPRGQKVHLLRMDDCMYSGIQVFGILDQVDSSADMVWHVCLAFASQAASTWLTEEFASRMTVNFYISQIVTNVQLPTIPWKMEQYSDDETYISTPLFFAHKISPDYRTTFSQIYLEGYNPDTGENTGPLVTRIPDRQSFEYIQSLY